MTEDESKLKRYEEIRQQFEVLYTKTTDMSHCFTQDAEFNYINAVVQLSWQMYLRGHADAYAYLKPELDKLHNL